MEKRLCALLKEVDALLNLAPCEADCSDEENQIYSEMANLKNALENAGYEDDQTAEAEKTQTLYAMSIVYSEGYASGKESNVMIFKSLDACIDTAYEKYKETWENCVDSGELDEEYLKQEEMEMLSKWAFAKELTEYDYALIQLPSSHVQYELFQLEVN